MKLSDAATVRETIFGNLGDAPGRALEAQFMLWSANPRFRAFAATYGDKVRKKLRLVRDAQGLYDVQLELEVASRLLRDRRFGVEYEKGAKSGGRHPDLAVTFRERTVLHLEVKRMRTAGADPEAKCAEVVCDAVQQLVPNALNALVIGVPGVVAFEPDLALVLRALHMRVEKKDDVYFQRRGFAGSRGFLRSLERLGAVATIDARGAGLEPNPSARRPMPADLSRALGNALAGS